MYFGYCLEKATNRVLHYWSFPELPVDTELYDYVQCAEEDKPELYEPEAPLVYDANALITWAMSQLFTAELIPHFAAFLDFANKANEVSKANFLAYATAVGLTSTANTIINKAVELGAQITGVE